MTQNNKESHIKEEILAVDALGRPIAVGDQVAAIRAVRSSAIIILGVVEKISTPQNIIVRYSKGKSSRKMAAKVIVISAQIDANKNDYPEIFI